MSNFGYGEPVKKGNVTVEYEIVPYTFATGETVYDVLGPEVLDFDEFFFSPEDAESRIIRILT